MKKEIKSIGFKVVLKGKGVVNFDGSNQKNFLKKNYKDKYDFDSLKNDNAKFAKKNFYKGKDKDGNEKDYFKLKISSDCVKRAIFSEDIDGVNSAIMHSPMLLNNFIATSHGILRGYMFASKSDTLKRKSVVTLTDAEECDNKTIPYLEFFSKGDENKKLSQTSLYVSETCGEIKYETNGFFSIKRLQFISSSPFFDRKGVKDDELNENGLYWLALKRNFGDIVDGSKHGYFSVNKNIFTEQVAETGLMLSQSLQKELFKDFFTRFLNMRIERKNAYCEVENIKLKLMFEPLEDDGYEEIEIKNIKDLDEIINKYDFKQYYEEVDDKLAKELLSDLDGKQTEKGDIKNVLKSINNEIKKRIKLIKGGFDKDDTENFNIALEEDEELQNLKIQKQNIENQKKTI